MPNLCRLFQKTEEKHCTNHSWGQHNPKFWQNWASLVAQLLKNPPAMQETSVRSLGWEDLLEKGKATQSSILAWRIPWTAESMGSQSWIRLSNFLKKAMAPHSSTLAWKIPWTEEPGRLQTMGSLRVRHGWVTFASLRARMGSVTSSIAPLGPGHCWVLRFVFKNQPMDLL